MAQPQPFAGQHQYARVDAQSDPTQLVRHLDGITALDQALAYKRQTYDLLRLEPGLRVLEVGCGAGDDARAIAERVATDGLVVGVDRSESMIRTARQRAEQTALPIEFRVGDALDLDFADNSFDGVRADRVLHHIADYERAFAEMVRVTRAGGRVVVFEPDFDGNVINSVDMDTTRHVVRAYADRFAQGQCGRQLWRLFKQTGLTEILVIPKTFVFTSLDLADQLISMSDVAQSIAAENPAQAGRVAAWLDELHRANDEGCFFFMLLGFMAAATKP